MNRADIDFDEIQKAMEDTVRDAFDYFLDLETGAVIILSHDIIARATSLLDGHFEDDLAGFDAVEFDQDVDLPDWMEDEIELSLNIFIYEKERFRRIPERSPARVFAAMTEFAEETEDDQLRNKLRLILDGKGSFRRFKDALEPYPTVKKFWYAFNAKKARLEIGEWLDGSLSHPGASREEKGP